MFDLQKETKKEVAFLNYSVMIEKHEGRKKKDQRASILYIQTI